MPPKTRRLGRAALWLGIVLISVSGVLAVIDGDWREVVFAALVIALAAVALVMSQTRHQR